jgi:ketosteroid isomerase-like protein
MSSDDVKDLISANKAFYSAFSSLSIDEIQGCCVASDSDVCIHPGWSPIKGWNAIAEAWVEIFESTNYIQVTPSDVVAQISGDVGWITCLENIYSLVGVQQLMGQVAATNIFKRTDSGWKLSVHHGSPIVQGDEVSRQPDV